MDGVNQGAISAYAFTYVVAGHTIAATFASLAPPRLAILANGSGGLNISWQDTYSGTLLTSPVLGPVAVWTPVTRRSRPRRRYVPGHRDSRLGRGLLWLGPLEL